MKKWFLIALCAFSLGLCAQQNPDIDELPFTARLWELIKERFSPSTINFVLPTDGFVDVDQQFRSLPLEKQAQHLFYKLQAQLKEFRIPFSALTELIIFISQPQYKKNQSVQGIYLTAKKAGIKRVLFQEMPRTISGDIVLFYSTRPMAKL